MNNKLIEVSDEEIIQKFDEYLKNKKLAFIYHGLMTSPLEEDWEAHAYMLGIPIKKDSIEMLIKKFPVILKNLNRYWENKNVKLYKFALKPNLKRKNKLWELNFWICIKLACKERKDEDE